MTAKELIKRSITMGHSVTRDFLKDLTDADILIRPAPSANHIAWQLGHLIGAQCSMVKAMGKPMPELPAGFAEAHSKETSKSDDAKKFAKLSEYLALWDKVQAATIKALDETRDADLDKPSPEPFSRFVPTYGDLFMLTGTHPLMHSGQFTVVRRKKGLPVVF